MAFFQVQLGPGRGQDLVHALIFVADRVRVFREETGPDEAIRIMAGAKSVDAHVIVPVAIGAGFLDVDPLFHQADLHIDANPRQLFFPDDTGPGVEAGTAKVGDEQIHLLPFGNAGLLQQRLGFLQIFLVIFFAQFVRGDKPITKAGWNRAGDGAGPQQCLFDQLVAVGGKTDRLAHPHIAPRLAQHVKDKDKEEGPWPFEQHQILISGQALFAQRGEEGIVNL